jgi:glutamine synthetase adenylyltransferase
VEAPESRSAAQRRDRQRARLDRVRIVGFVRDHTDRRIALRLPAMLTDAVRQLVVEGFDQVITDKEQVALIALGSFAVGEPRLFSDLDVIVVSEGIDAPAVAAEVQRLSRWFTDGHIVTLDFRLRGEGASSPLVQDLAFYRRYMERRISLWEKVAFAKCRHWWGGDAVANSFLELVRAVVARPFSREEIASLVQMRKWIESLAPRMHTDWDTKRSAGGRYDIEYLTAIGMAALPAGYEISLGTAERLARLRDHGLLDAAECDTLMRALSLYNAVEYFLELQEYSLPRSDEKSRQLDRYLSRTLESWGVVCPDGAQALLAATKQTVRACFDRFVRNAGSDQTR